MPARALKGLETPSGWVIGKMIDTTSGSGGNFCTRYLATSPEGRIGFLKAMDLSRVASGTLERMKSTIDEYLFEQEILEKCRDRKLTRVVTPLDSGEINSPTGIPPLNRVFYIIFELADGDLRKQYINEDIKSWRSLFKSLHQVAIGIRQLHLIGIIHQDIKPSNVLCFPNNESKISDLGRVTDDKGKSPFSTLNFTGDISYAPIEIHFSYHPSEFIDRRLSDLHMFGSLIFHVISGIQITPTLIEETRKLTPTELNGYSEYLPYFKSAFSTILINFKSECTQKFGQKIADELVSLIEELCDPDYNTRGNKRYKNKFQRLSMEKYVSKMASINRLAFTEGLE